MRDPKDKSWHLRGVNTNFIQGKVVHSGHIASESDNHNDSSTSRLSLSTLPWIFDDPIPSRWRYPDSLKFNLIAVFNGNAQQDTGSLFAGAAAAAANQSAGN